MSSRVNALSATGRAKIMKPLVLVVILLIFSPRPSVGRDDVSAPLRALEDIRSAEAARGADPGSGPGGGAQSVDSGAFSNGTPGTGAKGLTPSPQPFGTNLCLLLAQPTNLETVLTISNTVSGSPYEVITSPFMTNVLSNWVSAGIWIGGPGNTTPVPVALGTNAAHYFDARLWSLGRFPNSVLTNGQILLVLSDTNGIQARINGVSTNVTPFYANLALIDPPIYSLNLGYDASLSGPSNSTTYAVWPEQHIMGMVGYSSALTNLCLSYNPLMNLDVHGFPALQDLECWHCTNLSLINLTNCPSLTRACLEACHINGLLDLTGDTNFQEIRAAFNNFTNIDFGGAGPLVWHLCAHDNPFWTNIDFSQFPKLKQFWFWRANQSGSLALNSTDLASVQVYQNNFTSADFHGQLNLTNLEIDYDGNLTNLNVSGCPILTNGLTATYDALPTARLDSVLASLDATGASNGFVALYGTNNATLSVVGLTAMLHLTNKNWYVGWNPAPAGTPVISGVTNLPGSNSASITWVTDVPSDSSVHYGLTTSYGTSSNGNSNTTNHSVALAGLSPNTRYHFYVTSTSGTNTGTSWDYQFTTLGPPTTDSIYFVSTSPTITMVAACGGSALTWYWGDGSTDAVPVATHTFSTSGIYTNRLVVFTATSLTGFGVGCQTNAWTNTLSSVSGLTNYPNLQGLFFYQTQLSQLSLAGCSNLVYAALVGSSPTSAIEDQWFIDLANAEAALPSGNTSFCGDATDHFLYPISPGPTSASAAARAYLQNIGWTLVGN